MEEKENPPRAESNQINKQGPSMISPPTKMEKKTGEDAQNPFITFFASKVFLFGGLGLLLILFLTISTYLSFQSIKQIQTPPPSQPPIPTISPTLSLTPSEPASETANWKTYTDPIIGFSFRYPDFWKITDNKCSGPDTSLCLQENIFSELNGTTVLDFSVNKWNSFYSLDSMKPGETNAPPSSFWDFVGSVTYQQTPMLIYVSKKSITNNNAGVNPKFELTADFLNTSHNKNFDFVYSWPATSNSEPLTKDEENTHLQTFEALLSTFQFTTQTLSPTETQITCSTDADCPSGQTCRAQGPLIQGQTPKKVCVGKNQASPL